MVSCGVEVNVPISKQIEVFGFELVNDIKFCETKVFGHNTMTYIQTFC